MKAYIINMHLLVPRSRSSAKVKVKYIGYISPKMAVSGAFVFHKHILFFACYMLCITRSLVLKTSRMEAFENIVEKRRKMLVTSFFSFSHNVFAVYISPFNCCKILLSVWIKSNFFWYG